MLVFFGTSKYSAAFLEQIMLGGLKPDLVVSSPPKPTGRKKIPTENPTTIIAQKLNLPLIKNLKELLNYTNLQLGLILDFNKIIPPSIINLFSKGIINIHFSKLPRYRGPSPIQYTILNGETKAWITYFLIDEGLDTGPVIAQTPLSLTQKETTKELYQKAILQASAEISNIIQKYLNGQITPKPQKGTPTYTQKLTFQNCQINWKNPPQKIERLIRAAYPEPGAWTKVITKPNTPPKILKILKATIENKKLILEQVQLEGKNPVSWKQFQEGYPNYQFWEEKN